MFRVKPGPEGTSEARRPLQLHLPSDLSKHGTQTIAARYRSFRLTWLLKDQRRLRPRTHNKCHCRYTRAHRPCECRDICRQIGRRTRRKNGNKPSCTHHNYISFFFLKKTTHRQRRVAENRRDEKGARSQRQRVAFQEESPKPPCRCLFFLFVQRVNSLPLSGADVIPSSAESPSCLNRSPAEL